MTKPIPRSSACPHCSGTGRVPRGHDGYVVSYRYQDCTEYSVPFRTLREAREFAKGSIDDPTVNVSVIGPDGRERAATSRKGRR